MIKNRYLNLVINILFVVSIILILSILYRYFLEKNIYKNTDFLTYTISDIDDYNIAKNCVENYLFCCRYDSNNVGYFLHNNNKEKNKEYSSFLADKSISIKIEKSKKGFSGIYVVYYNINEKNDDVNRMVLKINGDRYQVLYDSIYESFEVKV